MRISAIFDASISMKLFSLSTLGLMVATTVLIAVHVHHCQFLLVLREFQQSAIPMHRIVLCASETGGLRKLMPSAINAKKRYTIGYASSNGSYEPVCLGASFGLHMTSNRLCLLFKTCRLISCNDFFLLHLIDLQ